MQQRYDHFLKSCSSPGTVCIFDVDDTLLDTENLREVENQVLQRLTARSGSRELWHQIYEEVRSDFGYISYREIAIRFAQALTQLGAKTSPKDILESFSQLPFSHYVSDATVAFIRNLKAINPQARLILLSEGDNTVQMMKIQNSGLLPFFDTKAHHIGTRQTTTEKKLVDVESFETLLVTGHNAFSTPAKAQLIPTMIKTLSQRGITNFVIFDDKASIHEEFSRHIKHHDNSITGFHVLMRYGKYRDMKFSSDNIESTRLLELIPNSTTGSLGSIYKDLNMALASQSPEIR